MTKKQKTEEFVKKLQELLKEYDMSIETNLVFKPNGKNTNK